MHINRWAIMICIGLLLPAGIVLAEETAQELYYKGVDYAIAKNFILAKKEFEKARELSPKWGRVKISLQVVESTLSKSIKAEAAAHLFSGISYINKDDINTPSIADSELAIHSFTKAIKIDSKYAMAYHLRGGSYLDVRLYDDAIRDLTTAIKLNPNFSLAYFLRGRAYYKKGYVESALIDYTKVIETTPDFAGAYAQRADIYNFHYDNKPAACADYKKYCELGLCARYKYYKKKGNCP